MSDPTTLDRDQTRRSIERELDLVAVAIQLVAGGGSPGVTLLGLEFGPAILAGSAQAAIDAGVILEPLWRPEESACDIRVHSRLPESDDD